VRRGNLVSLARGAKVSIRQYTQMDANVNNRFGHRQWGMFKQFFPLLRDNANPRSLRGSRTKVHAKITHPGNGTAWLNIVQCTPY